MKFVAKAVLVLAAALSLGSCQLWYMAFGRPVTMKFTALAPGGAKSLSSRATFTVPATSVGDGAYQVNFTPDSVLVPIISVGFEDSTGVSEGNTFWEAIDKTPANNRVDIASQEALTAFSAKINAAAAARAGTYDSIQIHYAEGDAHGQVLIKGSAVVNGATYYTHPAGMTTTGPAEYYTISLSRSGSTFPLTAGKVTVDAASATAPVISVFASVDGYAVANLPGANAESTSPFMTANDPLLVAYAGEVSPTVEDYALIFNSAADFSGADTNNSIDHGCGALQFILGADGEPIGVIAAPWSPGVAGWQIAGGAFFCSVSGITRKSDGSYLISNGSFDSSTGTTQANGLYIASFKRLSAVGDSTTVPLAISYDSHNAYYLAKRIQNLTSAP